MMKNFSISNSDITKQKDRPDVILITALVIAIIFLIKANKRTYVELL